MKLVTNKAWAVLEDGPGIVVECPCTLKMRANGHISVYASADESGGKRLLIGYGEGEIEMDIKNVAERIYVTVDRKNKATEVWVEQSARTQHVYKHYNTAFVEPLSRKRMTPEQEALLRLQRQNELYRRQMSAEFEKMWMEHRGRMDDEAQRKTDNEESRSEDSSASNTSAKKSMGDDGHAEEIPAGGHENTGGKDEGESA